jgi:hypothetical protein
MTTDSMLRDRLIQKLDVLAIQRKPFGSSKQVKMSCSDE